MWPYLLLVLVLVSVSHQSPVRLMANDDHNRSLLLQKALQQVVSRPAGSWMSDVKRAAADADAASFWKRGGGGRDDDDASFWKRGVDESDAAAFWKRSPDASVFWKREEPAAFWKRDQSGLEVLEALEIIKRFIEQQKQRGNKAQATGGKTRSFEVIDDNTSAGEIAADVHKEERRRGEDQMSHPEFNPTGW